ncbi:MAG: hypothetical protein B7Y83_10325 [Flavobacteriales bacterium 32-34-25]|nr:MAG: hypothetical protein B7Y83_10325 [Flavobacteriales bacterium 32-34-25]
MTPEQLKLVQQLAELGDVTIVKRGTLSLVNAISEMDSKALELILEDDVSYQDTSKTIFLQKLDEVFNEFKKEDKKLIAYKGKCNSNKCSNKNKNGISFVGNISGRYINFIIEENENGSVKDIYSCSDFCTNENAVDKNKKQLSFTVYKDENVSFKPSKAYTFSNNKSISAINELKRFNDTEISKEQIITWVKDYEETYNSIIWVNMFYKDQSPFYNYYQHVRKIYQFIIIEEEASFALEEFSSVNLNEEIQLLKWLVKFEHLQYNLILLHPNIVSEESINSGIINLHQDFKIYFKTEILKNCIGLEELFDKYYYEKLNKYNTLSKEEQENQIPFDDDYEKNSSLKYHLQIRGII